MMSGKLYITSLVRKGTHRGEDGWLYIVDLPSFKVIDKIKHVSLRGMCLLDNELIVADFFHTLYKFNEPERKLEVYCDDNRFSYLHLIYNRNGTIWTTNSGNNSIVKVKDAQVTEVIKLNPKSSDELHFNSIGFAPNGDEYYMYNYCGHVWSKRHRRFVVGDLKCAHDIVFINDEEFVVNDSLTRRTLLCNINGGHRAIVNMPEDSRSTGVCMWNLTRGLEYVPEKNLMFVATSPCMIHVLDVSDNYKDIHAIELSQNRDESTFDLLVAP